MSGRGGWPDSCFDDEDWRCPKCGELLLQTSPGLFVCSLCRTGFGRDDPDDYAVR